MTPPNAALAALLPCPFCGRSIGIGDLCSSSLGAAISCARCEASSGWCSTVAEARAAWNRRSLAEPGEVVAVADCDGRFVELSALTPAYGLSAGKHPLYTHPAAPAGVSEALGCFEAAEVEGWSDALRDGDIERIRDLWNRRISYAIPALESLQEPRKP